MRKLPRFLVSQQMNGLFKPIDTLYIAILTAYCYAAITKNRRFADNFTSFL